MSDRRTSTPEASAEIRSISIYCPKCRRVRNFSTSARMAVNELETWLARVPPCSKCGATRGDVTLDIAEVDEK